MSRRGMLAAAVLLVLAAYVVYPSLRTFLLGLEPTQWRALFGSLASANVRALWNSVLVSLLTVAGAGTLGTALAYGLLKYGGGQDVSEGVSFVFE